MIESIGSIWRYRGFILASVAREFRARYLNSLLGAAWALLGPLAMIVVYTLIFSRVMGSRLPGMEAYYGYSIYLCAGVLTWNLFADILTGSVTVFVDHANLIKKLNFPRLCLPLVVLLNALVTFVVGFLLFLTFLVISGSFPGVVIIYVLPLLLLEVCFALALGLLLGVVNVFFRDVGHLLRIGLQFWFWLTPVVYTVSILPEAFRPWMVFNPMTGLITAFQQLLVYGESPEWLPVLPLLIFTILLTAITLSFYRRLTVDLVDEL